MIGRRQQLVALSCVAAVTILGAGCGGGGTQPSTEAPRSPDAAPSKAEYVRKVDAICIRATQRKEAAGRAALTQLSQSGKPFTVAEERSVAVKAALPPLERMVEEWAELGDPPKESENATAILRSFENALAAIKINPAYALAHLPFAKPEELAKEYGLKACAPI
ncbi:MAG TPA: hypothetical protein VHS74_03055 [Solirubrobacterales bacterium]|jgi:hypothetical protein|nr:hypothetical protein [Solirubrobacterales bacterium]